MVGRLCLSQTVSQSAGDNDDQERRKESILIFFCKSSSLTKQGCLSPDEWEERREERGEDGCHFCISKRREKEPALSLSFFPNVTFTARRPAMGEWRERREKAGDTIKRGRTTGKRVRQERDGGEIPPLSPSFIRSQGREYVRQAFVFGALLSTRTQREVY